MRQILRQMVPQSVKEWRAQRGQTTPVEQAVDTAAIMEIQNILNPEFYMTNYTDLVEAGVDPHQHFAQHGVFEDRRPNGLITPDYVASELDQDALVGQNLALSYTKSGLSQKPRLLFVSHDATRTGAPAIILRLLDMFSKSKQFECFSLLDETGERLPEFQALSHTHLMSQSRRIREFSDQQAFDEVARLFQPKGMFADNPPVCALVNSAESCRLGRILSQLGIPVVSLIHEIAAYYPPAVFEDIAEHSRKMIFPSNFVSQAALRYSDIDSEKTTVRGQGLLEDGFGGLDSSTCRRILREDLGIEEDAFVVLNVGTIDIRKGADMFVDTAKLFFDQPPTDTPVYFVWYGAQDSEFRYVQNFIRRNDLADKVRLMPATSAIEQVFLGGDLFLLTARADPFPCVIHEAMACGLPVVAFRNGGGAPELIGEDCGTIIEMAHLQDAATAIRAYVEAPDVLEAQGEAAKHKIAEHWDYYSYLQDVYRIIQDCADAPPAAGWPTLPAPRQIANLVTMRGCKEDLEVLENLGLCTPSSDTLVTLVDGRFGKDAEFVVAQLQAKGVTYQVCQPSAHTAAAQAVRLVSLLKNPKPKSLTLINTLQHLSDAELKPLVFPVNAVQSDDLLAVQGLYARLPHLSRLLLTDQSLLDTLIALNPKAADIAQLGPEQQVAGPLSTESTYED